jgi:hypothetical protein
MSKESLNTAIREKEKGVLESKSTQQKNTSTDLVDETQVSKKIDAIEKKMQASALSPKYKEAVQKHLNDTTDEWKKKVDQFKSESDGKFKELFDKIVRDFEEFEGKPEVKEVFLYIEPLFANQKEIEGIINLESYGRSGDWEKINARLNLVGISGEKIKEIQKLLGITVDGKVGPQTINVINRDVYENQLEVKWADETARKTEDVNEFNLQAENAKKIIEGEAWEKIESETKGKLKGAKTLDDIKKIEEEEKKAKEKVVREAVKVEEPAVTAKILTSPETPTLHSEQVTDENLEKSAQDIPPEFREINTKLKLPEETLAIYSKAYMEVPDDKRIPLGEIRRTLETIEEKYLKDVDEKIAQKTLVEVLGKLVNGYRQTENLIRDEILVANVEAIQKKLEELQPELKKEIEKQQRIEEIINDRKQSLAKLVEANPDFYEFWDPSKNPLISQAIKYLAGFEKMRQKSEETVTKLEKEITGLLISNFESQSQLRGNHGESSMDLMMELYERLPNDCPSYVKEVLKQTVKQDPGMSEFDKLFYSGQNKEAFDLLAEQNEGRTKIPGIQGVFGEHDVISSYKRFKGSREVETLKGKLQKGSFAATKFSEGYIPIPAKNIGEENLRGIFLVKEQADGSLTYILVTQGGEQLTYEGAPKAIQPIGEEHTLSKEKITEIESQDSEIQKNAERVIAHSPNFKAMKDASAIINKEFAPIQRLLSQAKEGSKPEDFIRLLKEQARRVKESSAIAKLSTVLDPAQQELDKIKALIGTGITDEFEHKIGEMGKALSQVTTVVESNEIKQFCDYILSPDFEPDTFGRWALKSALPFVTTILAATTAVILACGTFGVGGIAGMALVAAAGALGGMAGHEMGTGISHIIGQSIYGRDSFYNKTLLGKYITEGKVLNPETGQYEDIKFSELAKIYGEQFVVGFVTTFVFLGLGKVAGSYLSKIATKHSVTAGWKGAAAKLLNKIPKLGKHEVDILEKHGFGEMSKRIGREFLEEMAEEGVEQTAERTHPALGFLASLYNSLDGRNTEYKLGKFNVVAESGATKSGTGELNTTWSYDASKMREFAATAMEVYGEKGSAIYHGADGTIIVKKSCTLKDGTVVTNKMTFKPSGESMTMRQLFTEGREGSDKSEIERLYGVHPTGENEYKFNDASPEGKITLAQYLQRRGFVISGDPATGTFEAVKGEEKVKFKSTAKPEAVAAPVERGQQAVESQSKQQDKVQPLESIHEPLRQILTSLDSDEYTPQKLLDALQQNETLREYYSLDSGVSQGYSVGEHTLMVLNQFEKYFGKRKLPGGFDIKHFRILLAMHDVGKGTAVKNEGNTANQHMYTLTVMEPYLRAMGIPKQQADAMRAMISDDPIGLFLKGKIAHDEAFDRAAIMAKKAGMQTGEFYELLKIYYQSDASSYTEDAGGERALDALFDFDAEKGSLSFSSDAQKRISILDKDIEDRFSFLMRKTKRMKKAVDERSVDISGFRNISSTQADQDFLDFMEGKISEKDFVDKLSENEHETGISASVGSTELSAYEKMGIYIQLREYSRSVENQPDEARALAADFVREAEDMLRDGRFGSELNHGTSSAMLYGLESNNGEFLSSAELRRSRTERTTGEGEISGRGEAVDSISFGKDADGLGTALAYAQANVAVDGYKNPLGYTQAELLDRLAIYEKAITKLRSSNMTEIPGGISGTLTLTVLAREASNLREAIRQKSVFDDLSDNSYPIVFGLKRNDIYVDETYSGTRTIGGVLSGEIMAHYPRIPLENHLETVYVPRDKIPETRKRLEKIFAGKKVDLEKIKIYPIETLQFVDSMRENVMGSSVFDSSYQSTLDALNRTQRKRFDGITQFANLP